MRKPHLMKRKYLVKGEKSCLMQTEKKHIWWYKKQSLWDNHIQWHEKNHYLREKSRSGRIRSTLLRLHIHCHPWLMSCFTSDTLAINVCFFFFLWHHFPQETWSRVNVWPMGQHFCRLWFTPRSRRPTSLWSSPSSSQAAAAAGVAFSHMCDNHSGLNFAALGGA